MQKNLISKNNFKACLAISFSLTSISAFAAKPVELKSTDTKLLQAFISPSLLTASAANNEGLTEISQAKDKNQTLHVRTQQTYKGHPVWGGEVNLHIPQGKAVKNNLPNVLSQTKQKGSSVNGVMFQALDNDLQSTPAFVFSSAQKEKALQQVIATYQKKVGATINPLNVNNKLMVYIDDQNKAHWIFAINFVVTEPALASPYYLIDAATLETYETWNNLTTEEVEAIGHGGSTKIGTLSYDGHAGNLSTLKVTLTDKETCTLTNVNGEATVVIKEGGDPLTKDKSGKLYSTTCKIDPNHKDDAKHTGAVYSLTSAPISGAYAPEIDALYGMNQLINMYRDLYQSASAFSDRDKPIKEIEINVNASFMTTAENAAFALNRLYLGSGGSQMYPLASLGVMAHEMGHAFTNGYSKLIYRKQSGGMNEAFSDMADQMIYDYLYQKEDIYGHKSWQVGAEIMRDDNRALRHMDKPSLSCGAVTKTAEGDAACPIDNMSQYTKNSNVHYTSGIYNRAFYLLATSDGWNVRKAFDVMVQANRFYWTSNSTFESGACGVLKAAKDFNYDPAAIIKAFNDVGVKTASC